MESTITGEYKAKNVDDVKGEKSLEEIARESVTKRIFDNMDKCADYVLGASFGLITNTLITLHPSLELYLSVYRGGVPLTVLGLGVRWGLIPPEDGVKNGVIRTFWGGMVGYAAGEALLRWWGYK